MTIKQFFGDVRRQKLRSLMTMFGIFWGTASIVLLFAFGQGISEAQMKSQKGMGENIAIVWSGVTSKVYKGLPRGRHIRPTEDDVILIKQQATAVGRISPEYSRWNIPMRVGKNAQNDNVVGIWPEFGEMRNLIPQMGSRFINDLDMDEKRRVVFIGNTLKKDLFGDDEAVGKVVFINNVPFTIIGVMKEKKQDSSYNGRDANKAFIPSTTFKAMFTVRYLNDIVVQNSPATNMAACKKQMFDILGARYKFDPTDTEALMIWDTTDGFVFLRNFFFAFKMFLVGIGIATLITGGIGVTNIMNVVLEERTKEIGIKMALGARKSYIMLQFVLETLLITAVGGVLGYLFAWALVSIFPMFGLQDYVGVPTVNVVGSAIVVCVLGIVGLLAGFFPARRAANLQPVLALKLF
jgi:putative ABC transport system permease protein